MSSNEQRRRGTRRATAGIALALAALGVATGACKGDPALSAADALSRARGEIEQRIQGRWRLVSFVPDEALSPMLQALLAFQFDRLTVEFDHGRLRAHSPGVEVDRAYRVERPAGDTFQLVVLDEQNIDYESSCEFDQTERLQFRSRSSTWQGHGVLERLFP